MKLCKNNHPLENIQDTLIILRQCVIHCHKCGDTATAEKATALYLQELYSPSGELFHVYYLQPNLVCKKCGTLHTTFAVRCYSTEESVENYKAYKTASPAKGIIQ